MAKVVICPSCYFAYYMTAEEQRRSFERRGTRSPGIVKDRWVCLYNLFGDNPHPDCGRVECPDFKPLSKHGVRLKDEFQKSLDSLTDELKKIPGYVTPDGQLTEEFRAAKQRAAEKATRQYFKEFGEDPPAEVVRKFLGEPWPRQHEKAAKNKAVNTLKRIIRLLAKRL